MASSRRDPEPEKTSLLQKEKPAAGRWLRKVIDPEEAKDQMLFILPMILTNVTYYFIPLLSVMFAGHLGEIELAGSNLANSWAAVTGFSLMVGLSGALETLCGQGFGAKMFGMLGVYLQASCIITIFVSIFVAVFWWFSDTVLILLHQDPQIAHQAGLYLRHLIPGLFAYGLLQNLLRFLQTQSVVVPLVFCSAIPLVLHFGIAYSLVHHTVLGYSGAPVAASISLWISVIMLIGYVIKSNKFKDTWTGFSSESLNHVFTNLKLALPSAGMVCLEHWAFEILVVLAGLMPNAEISTSLIAMCVNTEAIAYMVAYGLSSAASTRVSNEIGGGNPDRAKRAVAVTLKLTFFLGLAIVLALFFGHDLWASCFTDSPVIIHAYASMNTLLVLSISCDFLQSILSGVTRGCGWQHLAAAVNLAAYYLVGMPVGAVLGFSFKLYAKGLWIGLICGLLAQTTGLLLVTKFTRWTKIQMSDKILQGDV